MVIAILWVILLHSRLDISFTPLSYLRELGYAGVDIFCFASGIGLYCSYTKDHSPQDFLKRRLKRLLFPYAIFMLMWATYKLTVSQASVPMIIGNFLGIQGFANSGHVFNWYITFLVVTIVLTPFLAPVVERTVNIRKIAALLALMFLGTVPFFCTDHLILVTRLPLFVLGMLCGKFTFEIFLIHLFMFEVLSRLEASEVLPKSNGIILITIVLVFPLSLVLHKLSAFLCNYFERRLEQ